MSALHNCFFLSKVLKGPQSRNSRKLRCGSTDSRVSTTSHSHRGLASRAAPKDWKLVRQAIAGDLQAREELFSTHAARLYRTAFPVLRNKEDAEDAVQDALCSAFINLRSFEGRSSFATWLTRIVINSALMIRRRRTAHVQTSLDEMMDDQPERLRQRIVYTGPDPEELCATCQFGELLSRHIRQLPPAIRDAFQLYFLKGLSAADTCQTLGIGNSALKARIFRARHILADALRPTMHPDQTRKTRSIHQMAAVGSSLARSDTTN